MKNKLDSIIEKMELVRESPIIRFDRLLEDIESHPKKNLRNVFQLFYDMLNYYIPPGINEYPDDPYFSDCLKYDCSKLFEEGLKTPFYSDRSFINSLFKISKALKDRAVINRMILFLGPCGSGKTIFLNNILTKLEEYTNTEEGIMLETVWKYGELTIPCSNHDHPITQIPKKYRRELLSSLDFKDDGFKDKLMNSKEYDWVFEKSPCAMCSGIYKSLKEKIGVKETLNCIFSKRYIYNRKISEGITVYNPADLIKTKPIFDVDTENKIKKVLSSSTKIPCVHSRQAKTNNGVYAIMDAKSKNTERIELLHSLISDGVHKVDTIEEEVDSIFLTLMNPENLDVLLEEASFIDRIKCIPVPYARDYRTELKIYENIYGKDMRNNFFPKVLEFFAKIVVCSRLKDKSEAIKNWIINQHQYKKVCDPNFKLLKASLYSEELPIWLNKFDVKRFSKETKKDLIKESEDEGSQGLSGRESVSLFHKFYSKYNIGSEKINIEKLLKFFKEEDVLSLRKEFLPSVMNQYDYEILQQIKEAMFFYNDSRIKKDVLNYICAINNEKNSTIKCTYTGETFFAGHEYYDKMEAFLMGGVNYSSERDTFRNNLLKKYVSKTLQDMKKGLELVDTEFFKSLLNAYKSTLKEKVMYPFTSNANFRRALQEYGEESFKNYDKKIREKINLLIKNLIEKFGYTEDGAIYISLYVVDHEIYDEF